MVKLSRLFVVAILIVAIFATPVRAEQNFYEQKFQITNIPVDVMPVFDLVEGCYIIEPDTDFYTKAGIDLFHVAIKSISDRLKPFPRYDDDNDWIVPNVLISPIVEFKQIGMPGKIYGWLSDRNIVITSSVIKQGEKNIQNVFAHEFGHWVWFYILSEEEKQQYRDIAGTVNDYDRKLLNIYMLNSDESLIAEWFAEDFRLYACGIDISDATTEIYSKLGNSHGEPDKLQQYFNRFVN